VLELGHRGYATRHVSYSITAFHQRYDKLRSGSFPPPVTLVNQIEGSVGGIEAWTTWQATQAWRLSAGLLELREHLHSTRSVPDPSGVANLGNDPKQQWSLRSSLNVGSRGEFDVTDIGITVEVILQLAVARNELSLKVFQLARAGQKKEARKMLSQRLIAEQALLERILGVSPGSIDIFEPKYINALIETISKPAGRSPP